MTSKTKKTVEVFRCQLPLTHEDDMTFQNAQGKTIRGPEGQAKGFTIDLLKPRNMHEDENKQHVYMIMGRARKLEWMLLNDFPCNSGGEYDWNVFETGPPSYMCEFLEAIQHRAKQTTPRMLKCQRDLGMLPWEKVPHCKEDREQVGRYCYDPVAWGFRDAPVSATARPGKKRSIAARLPYSQSCD